MRNPKAPRHLASFRAKVVDARTRQTAELLCSDISRGGLFLCTEDPPPPIFAPLEVTLLLPDGPLPCAAEVVRHVTPDQAKAWQMLPGYGVQFVNVTPELRRRLAELVGGLPPAVRSSPVKALDDDPTAEQVLARFHRRLNGDPYVLLGLADDADADEVRRSVRSMTSALVALDPSRLSPRQRQKREILLERIRQDGRRLTRPELRAAYDATRGNFRGVARAIAAGLRATELEQLRAEFLVQRPHAAGNAHVHAMTARSWEARGQLQLARLAWEKALAQDPLNLALHKSHWAAGRREKGTG